MGRWLASIPFRTRLVVGLVLALTTACGGKSRQPRGTGGSDASGGTAGSDGGLGGATPLAGSGGSSPEGGAGDAGGIGGIAGAAGSGSGGTAGAAGGEAAGSDGAGSSGTSTGGAAGMAGAAATVPECQTAADCTMRSDCCGCRSEPRDAPGACALNCVRDACAEEQILPSEVDCVYGRCVIARRCDGTAGCPALPAPCPEGQVRSIVDDCYGACLSPTECVSVAGCESCGEAFCVEFQAQKSRFSCVPRVESCDRENYCECMGVCGTCTEADDGVVCPCLVC